MAATKAVGMSGITRQLSNMDLNKESKQTRPPILLKKTSSNLKLASKYAPTRDGGAGANGTAGTSGMSAAVKMAAGGGGASHTHTRTISQSKTHTRTASATVASQKVVAGSKASSRAPTPANAGAGLDIGTYDGSIETEYEKRGSAVFGEAAEVLALNSSQSGYVPLFYKSDVTHKSVYPLQRTPNTRLDTSRLRNRSPTRQGQVRTRVHGADERRPSVHPGPQNTI